jgi:hypothetical protein
LDTVLSTGNPNVDPESGHPIAYERILAHAQSFEKPPIFIKADAERITSDPKMSELVPTWMCTAERIAAGSLCRVPEDGPDTWNSDDEAIEDVLPDEEKGAYTAGMDPKLGPKKLSAHEAARQRATANALKLAQSSGFTTSSSDVSSEFGNSIVSSPQPSRQPTPASTPANSDDDDGMTEDQRRVVAHAKKCSAKNVPRCTSAPGTRPPPKKSVPLKPEESVKSVTRSRAVADPPPPHRLRDKRRRRLPNERLQRNQVKAMDCTRDRTAGYIEAFLWHSILGYRSRLKFLNHSNFTGDVPPYPPRGYESFRGF